MINRMGCMMLVVWPRAVLALAAGGSLFAALAYASVTTSHEPSEHAISESDLIFVARVNRVLGTEPFTNKNPPSVLVSVEDAIKGATRAEVLRVDGWVSGAPGWSEIHGRRDIDIRVWEAKPAIPPVIGAKLLLFLKRTGRQRGTPVAENAGPVFVLSPDSRTVELLRGAVWLTFAVRPIPPTKRSSRPIEIGGIITNRSTDSMVFDLRQARVINALMPTGLDPNERCRPNPPPPLRLAPGERREYSFALDELSPVPIGVPGRYWFGLRLPASIVNGQGNYLSVSFQIEGPIGPREAAKCSRVVFAATVDSVFRHRPGIGAGRGVLLSQHEFVLGDLQSSPPGNVQFVEWGPDLAIRPVRGRRYLFFLGGGWRLFHVAEANRYNLGEARAGLGGVLKSD